MKALITQKKRIPGLLIALVLFSVHADPGTLYADTVSIDNSISVSVDGTHAKASVKSVINGETVVDEELDGTNVEIHTSNGSVSTSSEAANTIYSERDQKLLELIEKLQTLIQYYVSLLNAQS